MLVKKLSKNAEAIVGITKFFLDIINIAIQVKNTIGLLYTSPSPRDKTVSRMPSSA